MRCLKHHLHEDEVYQADGHMHHVEEIPLTTIREFVANSLVHSNLSPKHFDYR
ncbi:hypothetical protein [Corynebacterium gerontici]|uniref:hypothetical protein n=1 Tax=Corynebacterium gerontici TaxID=2079234 RepID=UPI0013DE3E50|nr:hypothetical protein [Corynebacterium gerontici]